MTLMRIENAKKEFSLGMFGTASIHDNLSRVILGLKIEKIH